ncbi:MAG: hypothetical protein Q8M07_22700 [Prosthecobacter sp.]|nr:hypothetical protein [Prosthecobacter sp.]
MTHAELKARIDDGLPLTLHVADGRSFEVPHRDFIWLPPRSTVTMVAIPSPEDEEVTVSHTIPLLMVSGVTQTVKTQRAA